MTGDRFTGRAALVRVDLGSRHEHDAVVLCTGETSFQLRREGGNPFEQGRELAAFLDRDVAVVGRLVGENLLIVDEITLAEDDAPSDSRKPGDPS